ncbi:hypothetical protein GCM10028809_29340 [Spirosoma gilvum]
MSDDVFVGSKAGYSNTIGTFNTFIGHNAGLSNTIGRFNLFLGYRTGRDNQWGELNSFLGTSAGEHNTEGHYNTFLGAYAGFDNLTADSNVFLGCYAGRSNVGGNSNTFVGTGAGYANNFGYSNTFIGFYAGAGNTNSYNNTFIGGRAGELNTTGYQNTFLGFMAGSKNTTGSNNIIIGPKSGTAIITSDDNVLMGYNSQAEDGLQNAIALGANSRVSASNALILGHQVNVGIGTSAPASKLEIVADETDQSGLRLSSLTNMSRTTHVTDQFLTVNEQGDVVKARYQLRINTPNEWSDNVFSPTYQLRSLSSVAAYIDQHRHLPNVPSAEQVAKDGIDLVKINAILLEKVEELTLYSIQQDKTIQAQQLELQTVKQEQAELKRLLNQLLKQK